MKRGTPRHPKFTHLCEILRCSPPLAVGYLEMLWHFAAEFAPQGDVGRFSDRRIEAACGFSKTPGKLIAALIESGWLDQDSTHRLLIHDWFDHCDETTKKRLARSGKQIHEVTAKVTGQRQTTADNGSLPDHTLPIPEPTPVPVPNQALAVVGQNPLEILEELKPIYHRAGLPIPPKHEQIAVQLIIGIPPEKRPRISNYVKNCLLTGKWKDPTTTKSLLNLLRDGDWDVPLVVRELPQVVRPRSPTSREQNLKTAMDKLSAQRGGI